MDTNLFDLSVTDAAAFRFISIKSDGAIAVVPFRSVLAAQWGVDQDLGRLSLFLASGQQHSYFFPISATNDVLSAINRFSEAS